jgi:hypothetical protein
LIIIPRAVDKKEEQGTMAYFDNYGIFKALNAQAKKV